MKKEALRKNVMNRLKRMDTQLKKEQEQKLHEKLFVSTIWKEARSIAVTFSMEHEVDTKPVIHQALFEGKQVSLPVCDSKERTMAFYIYEGETKLKRTSFGVLEPDPKFSEWIPSDTLELVLVPGVVFSENGFRIGHGGGYYDRFLSRHPAIPTVSLALHQQLQKTVPYESHDIPVQTLIIPD